MRFERGYQLGILKKLAETAPTYLAAIDWLEETYRADPDKYAANLLYLQNDGLVISKVRIGADGKILVDFPPELTPAGINFLLDENTISFHTEEIRHILDVIIEHSDLSADEKIRYKEAIKDAAPEILKDSLTRAMEYLVNNAAAIAVWGEMLVDGASSS
ncbi:hypothetical protein LJC19_05070 [Oxalobacter sp. OttesenSCG-928-P03]|nr:hypothetical protein [Oxalobacter sp. OttesenSCG-928-P03]